MRPGARDEQFNWSGIVAPGQTVEIRNINGTVRADAAAGTQVEVSAVKTGNRNDPRDVRIEVVPHSGGGADVVVAAVSPAFVRSAVDAGYTRKS